MIELALANAVIVITITKSSLFKKFRENIKNNFLKKLFHCPYCLSHWTSSWFIILSFPHISFFNFIIKVFVLVGITSLFSFLLLLYLNLLDKGKTQ